MAMLENFKSSTLINTLQSYHVPDHIIKEVSEITNQPDWEVYLTEILINKYGEDGLYQILQRFLPEQASEEKAPSRYPRLKLFLKANIGVFSATLLTILVFRFMVDHQLSAAGVMRDIDGSLNYAYTEISESDRKFLRAIGLVMEATGNGISFDYSRGQSEAADKFLHSYNN